ncbi:type II toxin-antitoxin system RelE/ParE family toxin [Avibacterium avium]|uniref:Plasmid stabilization protein n=1 Tax=Avibacterium endocarditidis TaxID=380674 RepID=A0ABX4ZQH0_9PAST|nr:plasmid stabilization protein [Avibacterium endocarditidis]POY41742.1 plasmid stabilization protein [Avibacterium endocarditidis]
MMKFDYNIVWYSVAENKLLKQADYILQKSQNPIISEQFYDAIKSEVDKLSYTADIYKFRKRKEIPILNGKYQVKFLIGIENVYIVDFKAAWQNAY